MKHLLILILIVSLVSAPITVFAAGPAPLDVVSSDNSVGNITLPTDVPSGSGDDVDASLKNCQSSGIGGSLSSLLSRGLSALGGPSGLASLLGSSGLSSGNISSIIGSLTGNSSTGSIISGLLQGGSGGSSVTGILSSLFGGSSGSSGLGALGNIFGGSSGLGSIGNIFGGNIGSSGLGSLGNVLGGNGGLGSIAGGALGAVGGVFGGSEVPVNDATVRTYSQKIQGNTQQIQVDQDIYIKKVCVQDVLVRESSHNFASNFTKTVVDSANTANGGLPIYSENIAKDNATLSDAVHTDFIKNVLPNSGIDQKMLQTVQNRLDQKYQNDTQFSLRCPVENAQAFLADYSQGGLSAFKAVMVDHPECTEIGAIVAANQEESLRINSRLAEQETITQQAEGILPQFECEDPGGAGKPLQQCVRYRIVGPASVAKDTLNRGVAVGAEQQARASQIGDLVNSLFASLAQKAFTSLGGLMGLSKKSSTGSGSYLDQVTSATNSSAVAQTRASLVSGIESALVLEYDYQDLTISMLKSLDFTKNEIEKVKACYQNKITTAGGSADISLKFNTASSTIKTVLDPQITIYQKKYQDADTAMTALSTLRVRAGSASTVDGINSVVTSYSLLAQGGNLHSNTDIALLQSDHDSSKILLDGMVADAQEEVILCKAL